MTKAVAALKTTYGTDYKYGSIANVLCEYPKFNKPGTEFFLFRFRHTSRKRRDSNNYFIVECD